MIKQPRLKWTTLSTTAFTCFWNYLIGLKKQTFLLHLYLLLLILQSNQIPQLKNQQEERNQVTNINLSLAEQKFLPIVSDWLIQFRNVLWEGEKMRSDYSRKLIECRTCFVGDVREKVGLSRHYGMSDEFEKDFDHCVKCIDLACDFHDIKNDAEFDMAISHLRKYKIQYLRALRNLEKHLQTKHGVNLQNVRR